MTYLVDSGRFLREIRQLGSEWWKKVDEEVREYILRNVELRESQWREK